MLDQTTTADEDAQHAELANQDEDAAICVESRSLFHRLIPTLASMAAR